MTAVVSQNGWSANDRSKIRSYTIPGTTTRVALRAGDCSVVLLDFLAWFNKNIESIDGGPLDDWGYAERPIRGLLTVLSNHASGTAVDVNAILHALGHSGTFTAAQTAKIRAKLREYHGVIRWGGDYTGRPDEMHFEINAGAAAVRREADRIRGRASVVPLPTPRPSPDAPFGRTPRGDRVLGWRQPPMTGHDVAGIQRALILAGNRQLAVTGVYDPATRDLVNLLKARHHISEAGCGEQCWALARQIAHPTAA